MEMGKKNNTQIYFDEKMVRTTKDLPKYLKN
jgi:hypothetical protein